MEIIWVKPQEDQAVFSLNMILSTLIDSFYCLRSRLTSIVSTNVQAVETAVASERVEASARIGELQEELKKLHAST